MVYKDNPIICAVDTRDIDYAIRLSSTLKGKIGAIKLGLEFFTLFGIDGVKRVTNDGEIPLFLDLKFFDIPNTVAGAIKSSMACSPFLLTIHASGGQEMIKRSVEAAKERAEELSIEPPKILAVTLLTSLGKDYLQNIGIDDNMQGQVSRLANLASESGADGFVCSGQEVKSLNQRFGDDFIYVVPGIRSRNESSDDQKRVVTPKVAMDSGATFLVMGREITRSNDPVSTVENILEELNKN